MKKSILLFAITATLLSGHIQTIHAAEEISQADAVQCILGEARGEYTRYGYTALLALAEALRNRGTTKGVYGCRADFSNEADYLRSIGAYDAAVKAWHNSRFTNITKKADHWGSTVIDKKWIARMDETMTFTIQIGNHKFYREERKPNYKARAAMLLTITACVATIANIKQ